MLGVGGQWKKGQYNPFEKLACHSFKLFLSVVEIISLSHFMFLAQTLLTETTYKPLDYP